MRGASLAEKLQIPKGGKVRVVNQPEGFKIDSPVDSESDSVLFFAVDSRVLKESGAFVIEAARKDGLTWIAYPKAGGLGRT